MDAEPFTTLINQVIKILTSFIHDTSRAGGAFTTEVGKDTYQQGKNVYETVRTRFDRFDHETDDGKAKRVLENFMTDPEEYSDNFQRKLLSLLQADPDFAKKLRQIVSPPLFIGRDQELEEYASFLSEDSPWIWIFTALEGSGKTRLLEQMKKKTPSNISVIKLDFAGERHNYNQSTGERRQIDALKYLNRFATQLRGKYGDQQKYKDFEEECKKAYEALNANISRNQKFGSGQKENDGVEQNAPRYSGNTNQADHSQKSHYPSKDFFISYARADQQWAEWIAWQLEEVGYTTILQAWDFQAGGNFVLDMDTATKQAERTIAVLSPDYLVSRFTRPEWAAVFQYDPEGKQRLLVPVRVRPCDVKGLLGPIVYIDLIGQNEQVAKTTLLAKVKARVNQERDKPTKAPSFPRPTFPGALSSTRNDIKALEPNQADHSQKSHYQTFGATSAFHELMDSFEPNHLVIQLDTCEWLIESENAEFKEWLLEDILHPLYQMMHKKQKKCHVVMMSNIALPLQNSEDIKQSSLERLDQPSVEKYLQRIGVDDSKLRSQFYDMTDGHALCVDILCKLWQQWESEGKQISPAETFIQFQQEFSEETEKEFIDKHILDKFRRPSKFEKSPLHDLTRYGTLLREFNLPLLMKVFPELLPESRAKNVFEQLINLPYIMHPKPHKYAVLELLRTVLGPSIRVQEPKEWQLYHGRAMSFFKDQAVSRKLLCSVSRKLLCSVDWHYHLLAHKLGERDNGESGRRYWIKILARLKRRKVIPPTPLLDAACDKTLMFTSVAFEAQKYKQRGS